MKKNSSKNVKKLTPDYFFALQTAHDTYRAFHRFGQAKFPNGGLVLGSSKFSVQPQLPPEMMLSQKRSKLTQN